MTDNKDELLVKRFFDDNRIEVPDDGFSRRVMRRLPDRAACAGRIWTAVCAVVALLFFIKNDFLTMLWGTLKGLGNDIITNDALRLNPQLVIISLLTVFVLCGYRLIAEEE